MRDRMRTSFVAFAAVAIVVATLMGSTAFNYAQVGARTVTMNIVQDDGAVVAIARGADSSYDCYTRFDSTTGKISVTFDGGSPSCSGGASGLNPATKYHFLNILKITNKGQKDWQKLWVNSTSSLVTTNLTISTDATMTTGSTFAQNAAFGSTVAIGDTIYVGIYVDGSGKTKADNGWTADLTVEARASA
jgi:hypothetical protein